MGYLSCRAILKSCNMKNYIWIFYLLFIFVSCGTNYSGNSEESDTITKDNIFSNDSIIGIPLIMDFSATWCPPCQQFKPIFEEAKKAYSGKIEFRTIDVDAEKELAQKFNISSIPSIIFIDAEGNEVNRIIGFTDKNSFEKAIKDNFNIEK